MFGCGFRLIDIDESHLVGRLNRLYSLLFSHCHSHCHCTTPYVVDVSEASSLALSKSHIGWYRVVFRGRPYGVYSGVELKKYKLQ